MRITPYCGWALGLLLLITLAPSSFLAAQGGGQPITPQTAGEVVQLARFGRGLVYDVTWSPDGSRVLVAGSIGAWLYDPSDVSAEPVLLAGHSEPTLTAAFSPDNSLIVTGGEDDRVLLWDATTGTMSFPLESETRLGTIQAVAFSAAGDRVAASGGNRTIHIWNPATGEELVPPIEGHTSSIYSLAFSPDGSLLASGSSDATVRLWAPDSGEELALLDHPDDVRSLAFSPDGSRLITACYDDIVRVWDVSSPGEAVIAFALEGHERDVNGVDISPDGSLIASASDDGTIRLWDMATGATHQTLELADQDILDIAFSPDGTQLASASSDQTIRFWEIDTGLQTATAPGHTHRALSVAFNPGTTLLISGHTDSAVFIWKLNGADDDPAHTLSDHQNINGNKTTTTFTPDGARFASADGFGVTLWDVKNGQELLRFDDNDTGLISGFTLNPEGTLLAVSTWDGPILLWDMATGQLLNRFYGHTDRVNSLAFSANGDLLASASDDGTVLVWGLP